MNENHALLDNDIVFPFSATQLSSLSIYSSLLSLIVMVITHHRKNLKVIV